MKVQVIVPAINLWEKYSKGCIESIQVAMMRAKKHGIESRLLFIDNASTDETSEEASKMVSDLFCHQRNEERWGFQKSVNFGVNDAWERGYDYTLVCNNDILLHPEAIWRLAERFEDNSKKILKRPEISAKTLEEEVLSQPQENEYLELGMATCMDVRAETTPALLASMNIKEKEACGEAPHPNFSAFMVSKELWDVVGEFDEVFFPAYFEDNDYHYRMKLADYAAVVLPPALFLHFGSGTQNEANEDKTPIVPGPAFEKNRLSYARKWGGVPGSEIYTHPYNNDALDISSTKQDSQHADAA